MLSLCMKCRGLWETHLFEAHCRLLLKEFLLKSLHWGMHSELWVACQYSILHSEIRVRSVACQLKDADPDSFSDATGVERGGKTSQMLL